MARAEHPVYQCVTPSGSNPGYENQRIVYPSLINNGWKTRGDTTIQGTKWKNTVSLTLSGDPTTDQGAVLKLKTGSNQDCNAFWGSLDYGELSERHVRGIHFRNWTNSAKFRPRITGVAMVYMNGSGTIKYSGLQYRGNNYWRDSSGQIQYEDGYTNNYYWAVSDRGKSDGNYFHDPSYMWAGVLFHYETTYKSGSAVDCNCYISRLRPIVDAEPTSVPYYNNKYRLWGARYK